MTGGADSPIGRGRTSDVFTYGEGRAIKLYPKGTDRAEIEAEADAAELVNRLGVPSVACYGLATKDGRTGIVFDLIDGDSLTDIAEADIAGRFVGICRTLADCHLAMHAVHTTDLPDVRQLAAGLLESPGLAGLTGTEKQALREYLRSLPDGDSVLHLDYHPQNVFAFGDGYAIIDWHSACRGAAAADVAMSVLLMREAELFPGTPLPKLVLYAAVRSIMLRIYLKRYLESGTVTRQDLRRWQTCARVLRLGLLNIDSEKDRLTGRIRTAIRKGQS